MSRLLDRFEENDAAARVSAARGEHCNRGGSPQRMASSHTAAGIRGHWTKLISSNSHLVLTTARSFRIERLGLFRIEAYRDTADDADTWSIEATSFGVWIVSRRIASAMPVPILSFLVAQAAAVSVTNGSITS
jgi:hypothetical protein